MNTSGAELRAIGITASQYWMGRDTLYRLELTPEIRTNAAYLLAGVNALLVLAAGDGVVPGIDEKTGNYVASGWRPLAINDRTSHAAKSSTHILGLGVDLQDHRHERLLARWCLRKLQHLERLGLYMEDPRWTPDWVHLQRRAPGSGKRVYVPSSAPALALALPEQASV
jgi:hypothetical protein